MSNVIQFKRNPGVTGPTTSELVAGEPAIAMDGPTGANSKLYIGISDSVTGSTTSVVPIGGAYYTNYIDSLVTGGVVNTVNGLTGNVTLVDLVGVSTYNGVSGAVEGACIPGLQLRQPLSLERPRCRLHKRGTANLSCCC